MEGAPDGPVAGDGEERAENGGDEVEGAADYSDRTYRTDKTDGIKGTEGTEARGAAIRTWATEVVQDIGYTSRVLGVMWELRVESFAPAG